ncbi:MBL fold metallo-hydrolase [Streptomyces antimicrobicus]|uniref:MBL fold metallo-hydrolase n=1 Tax=Streptomyces antimicrobicus TaxID=2883108 RepID=A0ABS8B8U4_9ACTN|nr:MBL fold metallo-hydrolase [Streptomyces antimicrobicus]MCB5181024.1 MBL fold metallo-hydrolase [Streptomyces antimicrobicus]
MSPRPAAGGRLVEVADGVHAYLQPHGGWCLNNAGLVVGAGGACTLVDTAATEDRARTLRAHVLARTGRPPRTLVNTHFHGDHTFGNSRFPEAVVVAHESARAAMTAAGLHLTSLWPEVRWGELEVALPDLTFTDTLTLWTGGIRIELLHLGPAAHTTNDIAVWLPEQRVLFTGDVVMSGITPFCLMGSVSGSLAALDRLRALDPLVVVPGHGPLGGPELLDADEGYFRWLRALARDGFEAGLAPLDLARLTGPGPYAALLDAERLVPNLHRAYAELRGARPGEPLDVPALFREMTDYHGGLPACHA